jgi:phosphohistidine swiveling domain-containing protein
MEWQLVTTNRNPLLIYELKIAGFRLGFQSLLGFDYSNIKWDRGKIFAHVPTHAAIAKALSERYEQNPTFFDRLFSQERTAASRLLATSKDVGNLDDDSSRSLWSAAERFFQDYPKLTVFLMVNVICGVVLEEKLDSILSARGDLRSKDERRDFALRIARSAPATRTSAANRALSRIGLMQDARARNKAAQRFARRFAWISLEDGFGTPLDTQEVLRRAEDMCPMPSTHGQREDERDHEIPDDEPSAGLLGLSTVERTVAAHFQEVVFLRTFVNEEINRCGLFARPLFLRLAERLGASYDSLFYARADEIGSCLAEGRPLPGDELRERREGYAVVMQNGRLRMFWGGALRRLDEGPSERAAIGHVFHGQVACKGCAAGTARIVSQASDLGKLQQGDILIAGALTPDYTVGIRKAAGISSDVGGMNCHAAIISREFGIPCVVGLQSASCMLSDGDIVRLDAEAGTLTKEGDAGQSLPRDSHRSR